MNIVDFSHMADLIGEWANEDPHDLRSGILILALENAAGYDPEEIKAFAYGDKSGEYAQALHGLLMMYAQGNGNDEANIAEFFRITFEHGLRPAWDTWHDIHDPQGALRHDAQLRGWLETGASPPQPKPKRQ